MIVAIRKRDRPFLSSSTLLVYIWLLGIISGTVIALLCRAGLSLLLVAIYPVIFSLPCKLILSFLPFLLSAFAVYFSRPAWLFLICGTKAALFSFRCAILCLYYGQAGWLARWIFLFSEVCSLPLLLFYCLRSFGPNRGWRWFEHIIFFLVLVVLILIDYRIVTPYAGKFGII